MQKSEDRKFAFIINYGIEYRMFFISGLLKELSKNNKIIVIKRDINNNLFHEYESLYNFNILNLEKRFFEKKRLKLENIFKSIRESRLKLLKKKPFKNYNIKTNTLKLKDFFKGNKFIFNSSRVLTLKLIEKKYEDIELKRILKENNITDIIMSGYSSTANISFAINALHLNIKVWSFINSWKDYYINDFLPFQANSFFVWSESMKKDFLSTNPHIKPCSIISSGNIIFDRFYKPELSFSRNYYENKYKIKNTNKIFLYCMMDSDRYKEEEKIILLISQELKKLYKENFKLLVKKNPFNKDIHINTFLENQKNIIVLEHFSERDKKNDFFIQSYKGEREWIDILKLVDCVIGVASTIALEAIMMHKPVITIGFNKYGYKDNFLIELSNMDFYKKLLQRKDIFLCKNSKELINILENISMNTNINYPEILGIYKGNSLLKVIKEME